MKHRPPRDETSRFKGSLRHYHRAGSQAPRTWDEWIDGAQKSTNRRNWLKIILIVLAILGLAGILIGLFIELR